MKLRIGFGAAVALIASPALAGPPYLTDDPVPTDLHHWEIFAFAAGDGHGSDFDGDLGVDLNYGAVEDLQLTATVPLRFSHSADEDWHGGSGDLEIAAKYRIINDEAHGFSASVFPRVILPTAAHAPDEKTRFLLPVWIEKDFAGGTSVFGGGGYAINPGSGNRNYWQAGLAVTHDLSEDVTTGIEVAHQGADADDGTPETSLGAGMIVKVGGPYALLFSGGPTWADHQASYHAYAALGVNF